MTRYHILRADDPVGVAFGKKQASRLIDNGIHTFTRSWPVNGGDVHVRSFVLNGQHHVKITSTLGGISSDGIYALGSFSPTLGINRSLRTPSFNGQVSPLPVDIYGAIIKDAKVSRGQAYPWANGNFVSTDSTTFGIFAAPVEDIGGTVYTAPVPALPRKIDYANNKLWYSISRYALLPGVFWVAADLNAAANGYVSTFTVPLVNGKVPDGDKTFNVPVSTFTVPVTASFKAGVLFSFDTTNSRQGLWVAAVISVTLSVDTVTITYNQNFNGATAVFIVDSWFAQTPSDVSLVNPPSSYVIVIDPTPAPLGLRWDVTVPSTSHVESHSLREFTGWTPAVSSDPFPVATIAKSVNDTFISGFLIPAGNGGFGDLPYVQSVDSSRAESLTMVFSDGSVQSVSDPTASFSSFSGNSGFTAEIQTSVDIIGANAPRFDYQFPVGEQDIRDITVSEKDPALGYEVFRYASPISPTAYERFDIRLLDGTVLRTSYRPMAQVTTGVGGLENYTVTTVDNTGAWVQSGTYTTRFHTNLAAAPFILYDTMVSVNEHVFVLNRMTKTGIGADTVFATVPFGWAVAVGPYKSVLAAAQAQNQVDAFKSLGDAYDQSINPVLPARPQFPWTVLDDNGFLPSELQDARNRITQIVSFCRFMQTVAAEIDGSNVVADLHAVLDFFNTYGDVNADQTFTQWVNDLISQYTVGSTPRVTPLTAAENSHLLNGFLSTHMRIVTNALNFPYSTILSLGAGTWFWITK